MIKTAKLNYIDESNEETIIDVPVQRKGYLTYLIRSKLRPTLTKERKHEIAVHNTIARALMVHNKAS